MAGSLSSTSGFSGLESGGSDTGRSSGEGRSSPEDRVYRNGGSFGNDGGGNGSSPRRGSTGGSGGAFNFAIGEQGGIESILPSMPSTTTVHDHTTPSFLESSDIL
jgi:hypothetical protein